MIEWWLQRCEWRPWRSFILLWMVLSVALLLLGLGGFRHASQNDVEPPKEATDYRAFLPGGVAAYEFTLHVDNPDALPQFNSGLERGTNANGLRAWIASLDPAGDGFEARLTLNRPIFEGRFGWPLLLAEWRRFQAWDVTDPFAGHFAHAPKTWANDWRPGIEVIGWQIANDGGSRITGGNFYPAAVVAELLFAQFAAATIVWLTWLIARRRTRIRIREGSCLACGHALGPPPRPNACPECAQPSQNTPPLHKRSLAGRTFIVALIVEVIAVIALSVVFGERKGPADFAERQAQLLASDQAAVNNTASSGWFWDPQESASYGLGGSVIHYVRGQWLLLTPTSNPIAGIHPAISTGFTIDPNARAVGYEWVDTDDYSWSHVRLHWQLANMQVAALQFAALAVAFVAIFARGFLRRSTS